MSDIITENETGKQGFLAANYHTHTRRCNHASGEDREYVEAAIQTGLRILGFADHCPWVFPRRDYVSNMRMAPNEVDGYFYSLESLKKEYAADIKIYIGFETEHCPGLIEAQDKLLADYPLDYMIQGQHFLGVEYDSVYTGWKHPEEEVLKGYVDIAIEGINSGRYLYMAHPDLVNFTGEEELYRVHMKRLCEAMKKADVPLEINILGLWEGRQYPAKRFLKLAQETGNKAIIGMDAHAPVQLLNRETVERAKALCAKYQLELLDGDLLKK